MAANMRLRYVAVPPCNQFCCTSCIRHVVYDVLRDCAPPNLSDRRRPGQHPHSARLPQAAGSDSYIPETAAEMACIASLAFFPV